MESSDRIEGNILPETAIRATALNGANLVPKSGSDAENIQAGFRLRKLAADLLLTISLADVSGGHKTAACNLLCTVISQCSQSHIGRFHNLIWDEKIWVNGFEVFLTQNHALSVKPLRQLLTTLTAALDKCQDQSTSKTVKTATVERLAGILCSTAEHVPIRPAMQALGHFLLKQLIYASNVYEAICSVRGSRPVADNMESQHALLMDVALKWAPYDDYSSSSGLLASAILESIKKQTLPKEDSTSAPLVFHSSHQVSWAEPILKVLYKQPTLVETYRHYVLPELFKHDLQDFISFCERLGLHQVFGGSTTETAPANLTQDHRENLLFCALSVGNKMGLVQVGEFNHKLKTTGLYLEKNALCIPDTLLGNLILRSSATVRIAGLSMLVASNSTTKPLSLGSIKALKNGLPCLHADADAGFRSEMFSLVRNLTDRLRGATSNLYKLSTGHGTVRGKGPTTTDARFKPEDAARLLQAHRHFLEWYVSFIRMELRPSASYQRHISAIKCILLVYKSGVDSRIPLQMRAKTASPTANWPFHLDVITPSMTDLLLDLLLDPFDDVRQGAAEILSIAPNDAPDHDDANRLVTILRKAEAMMMSSGRADQADGVAHLYNTIFSRSSESAQKGDNWWLSKFGVVEHLLKVLETTLEIAAKDMSKAVSKHPLHGLFISLRYIMENASFYKSMAFADSRTLQSIHLRLYACFHSVWSSVNATLCNDAPEGYVPDDMDEDDDIGTKDVLSYSWRALKEASLLMRTVVKSCPLSSSSDSFMTSHQLRDLGELSFTQLAELRHRGAFSTVSQTFATCCVRCNSGSESTSGTLQNWYKQAMLCIQNQTTINTRRSAGLPSLMVGIIIADDSKGELYHRAVRDLTVEAIKPVDATANQDGGLSQVHAMNCLKDMFKNSRLGEKSEPHVPEALSLAASCLSSETWAIRNSGLMLFRALLDRLLGTNEAYANIDSAPQSRLSFAAVPNLMGVIHDLISPPLDTTEDMLTEGVFPALQLLQRTPPPADHVPEIQNAVRRLTESSQWHIRDKAAQTYAIMTPASNRTKEACRFIEARSDHINAVHGALLSARYILQNVWETMTYDDLRAVFSALTRTSDTLFRESNCPYTKAAYVDIYNDWCSAACKRDFDYGSRDLPISASKEVNALLVLDRDTFAACSALRQSLSHAALQENAYLQSTGNTDPAYLPSLLQLSTSDGDACTTMLIKAAKLCNTSDKFRSLSAELLSTLCTRLLFGQDASKDVEVQSSSQDVLLALLDSKQSATVQEVLRRDTDVLHLPNNAATPLFHDKRLVLQGALLELRFGGAEASGRSLSDDFKDWTVSIGEALHEDNPFDTRLAAAYASARIRHGLVVAFSSPKYSSGFLTYCHAVYRLTNDDDEDVRNVAARTACSIIQAASQDNAALDLLPIPAGAKLVEIMTQRFNTSTDLAMVAMSALFSRGISATTILADANRQDTALFIQEKQNLFIDEAREARLWSHVLVNMSSKAVTQEAAQEMARWTMEGLDTLLTTLEANADGPLGWKRRPEIFVLGLKIIYAAEVLLVLRGRLRKLKGVNGSEIRKKLMALLKQGQEKEMHPLWLEQSQRVLERAIVRGAGSVARNLSAVPSRLAVEGL